MPAEQIRELLRRAEEKDLENAKRQRDYTYLERVERHRLDGHGGIDKTETVIFETCAHAPIYESVDEFNQKTLSFLNRQTG